MSVPLPNLDDRRWADLIDEGRSLIPLYAPGWSDHNAHDPGITLMELLAWIAEMDIYSLNRISDEHKRKFLGLVGVRLSPPNPARAVVSFRLKLSDRPVRLPAGTEVAGADPFGEMTTFRTLARLRVAAGSLAAILLKDSSGYHDLTGNFERGEATGVFGAVPERGAEIYFGFNARLQRLRPVSLYFTFAGGRSGEDERERLIEETLAQKRACQPPPLLIPCEKNGRSVTHEEKFLAVLPPNDRVRLQWEFLTEMAGQEEWIPLSPDQRQVTDDTRAFTLDGSIVLRIPRRTARSIGGPLIAGLYYIRCRFEAGAYDAPPIIKTVSFNGVAVEQSAPNSARFKIRRAVTATGTAPVAGASTAVHIELDGESAITALSFDKKQPDDPEFKVLDYQPSSALAEGQLGLEAIFVGHATAVPLQEHSLPGAPIVQSSLRLFTLEEGDWRSWERRSDLEASGNDGAHFVLEATSGVIQFGDGRRGRLPRLDSLIVAQYDTTRADEGNLAVGKIDRVPNSPHNRALVNDFDEKRIRIESLTNPVPAALGAAAESLNSAIGRAIELVGSTWRAVTLTDYEELAKKTPGARVARASARASLHPSFPCFKAPGLITLIVVPEMPVPRPTPSAELKRAVKASLHRRRVIGTRVEVVGPVYVEVAVRARVKGCTGASRSALRRNVTEALDRFFDPLKGGPDGSGWPFGRDVYRSEVMQVIEEVPGVDHVVSLELLDRCGEATCGNICLGPASLIAAGRHEIEVV
ncbi:MAG: putative baseplate assembly protein [Blastocatellia bacterium]